MWLLLLAVIAIGAITVMLAHRHASRRKHALATAQLDEARTFVDEDVTTFGEELRQLHSEMVGWELDDAIRQDHRRALDEYETARLSLQELHRPGDVAQITRSLEDGRYAVTRIRARVRGDALPQRRPPCFFDPRHGPSYEDVEWAPGGETHRTVPVCVADAERVKAGSEPEICTVRTARGDEVPYWEGGPVYAGWIQGYFAGFANSGLVPTFPLSPTVAGAIGWYGAGGPAGGGADVGGSAGGGADVGGPDT